MFVGLRTLKLISWFLVIENRISLIVTYFARPYLIIGYTYFGDVYFGIGKSYFETSVF